MYDYLSHIHTHACLLWEKRCVISHAVKPVTEKGGYSLVGRDWRCGIPGTPNELLICMGLGLCFSDLYNRWHKGMRSMLAIGVGINFHTTIIDTQSSTLGFLPSSLPSLISRPRSHFQFLHSFSIQPPRLKDETSPIPLPSIAIPPQ